MAENKIKEWLRRLKLTYTIFNFTHRDQLEHNRAPYKQFGLNKKLFSSLSFKDTIKLNKGENPWLDQENHKEDLNSKLEKSGFSDSVIEQIKHWSQNGYLVLKQFLSEDEIAKINSEINRLIEEKKVSFHPANKIMFANKLSPFIDQITHNKNLKNILSFILGKNVIPFQTINFLTGSEQKAHSDSIHMTTHPQGFLIAAWIALEDIDENCGPIAYYPGSQKLPYVMNKDYERGGNSLTVGADNNYFKYEDKIETVIKENNLEKKIFTAKKGDVLIWHANLIHGGEPIISKGKTRLSMVIHYFAEGVIKYHEITERPALL